MKTIWNNFQFFSSSGLTEFESNSDLFTSLPNYPQIIHFQEYTHPPPKSSTSTGVWHCYYAINVLSEPRVTVRLSTSSAFLSSSSSVLHSAPERPCQCHSQLMLRRKEPRSLVCPPAFGMKWQRGQTGVWITLGIYIYVLTHPHQSDLFKRWRKLVWPCCCASPVFVVV